MAPLNLTELSQIAIDLQTLVAGAQLQEVVQSESEAGLGFYHDRQMVWLWFDLNPQRPLLVRLSAVPHRKKIQRPLTLFLKSRFTGRRLETVRVDLSRGRVLIFKFFDRDGVATEIEAHLIPHAPNLVALNGPAQVAENKPKELPPQTLEARGDESARTLDEITQEWLSLQTIKPRSNEVLSEAHQREKKWAKAVEKKRAALERMREELSQKTSNAHRELGEWLKANGRLDGAPHPELLDHDASLSENIEAAFYRAKENERKANGTRERIALVENELRELEELGPQSFQMPRAGQPTARERENLLVRAAARGRRHLVAQDLEVYIGKSAADNLSILRKAQPFDYWLHLRDFPGSHAIMRRTRGRNVTDAEFQEAGRWVIEQSLGASRAKESRGEKFDLLIVECRFVRPIKGDKLGRVHYTNDRVMTLRF